MVESRVDGLARHAPAGGLPLAATAGYLIRRSQQVHNQLWSENVGAELTSPQYAVLASLAAWPGIDQRQLGELASLDKSSVADVVKRLVARSWVVRHRDGGDARRNILELTTAATRAFEHLTPAASRVQTLLLEPLPPSTQPRMLAHLQLVARLDSSVIATDRPAIALGLDAPGHLIRRAQQVHTSLWLREFDGELTGPQYAAMHVTSLWAGVNQRQLGELAALDKSTGADLIDRLERRGWLRRHRDPVDGRGKVVHLTDVGTDAVLRLAPRVSLVQDELLRPVPQPQRADFLASLAQVAFEGDIPAAAR